MEEGNVATVETGETGFSALMVGMAAAGGALLGAGAHWLISGRKTAKLLKETSERVAALAEKANSAS